MSERQKYIFWRLLIIVLAVSGALTFSLAPARAKLAIDAPLGVPTDHTNQKQAGVLEIQNGSPSSKLSLDAEIFTKSLSVSGAARPVTANTNPPPVAYPDYYTAHGPTSVPPYGVISNDEGVGLAVSNDGWRATTHGSATLYTNGSFSYTPDTGYTGSDSFNYTVCDIWSACASSTVTLTVVNLAPTPGNDSYTAHGTLSVAPFGVLVNDSDPENDTFSITDAGGRTLAHGTLTLYTSGSFNYIPNYGYTGSDSFTYTVQDNLGKSTTATVSLTVVNQAPTPANDSYTFHGTTTVPPFGVLVNDSDPENDILSITDAGSRTLAHGTLTLYTSGSFNYIPNYGYTGSDAFTYTVQDNLGESTTATVSLTIVNQAPTPMYDSYTAQGTLAVPPFGVLVNDSDPENDILSITDAGSRTLAHGTLTLYTSGSFYYVPTNGYGGSDSFTYTLSDNLGATSTATVYILIRPERLPEKPPYGCGCPSDPTGQSSFSPQSGGFLQATGGAGGEYGPQYPDPVNLATGGESYTPAPDLTIYNPSGPSVQWQRSYSSDRALAGGAGYASLGLSRGWVHNYDMSIEGVDGVWGALTLSYPNGARETLVPQLSAGEPTGGFNRPAGSPYIVTGVAGSPAGTWQSVTVTWKDQTKWKFTRLLGSTYALNQITNRTGQSINFAWTTSRALTQISDAGTSTVMLTLAYDSSGKLSTATDAYGRKIAYTFAAGSSSTPKMLQSVSQLVSSGTSNPPAHWTYTYTTESGQQLNTITTPSPTGTGDSTATINYDAVGKVTSLVDANGNQRVYTYGTNTTQVQVKDVTNNVVLSWTQKFNASGLDTGITDAGINSTTVAYADTANPLKPTSMIDRNGHTTSYTYDQFGNVLTVTTPRSLTTTYTWSYTNFALGRLTSVQEGSKPATTFTYYEPSGLIYTVTRPAPNSGTGTTATTYTYDSLGNPLTVVAPGNDATTSITTTFNYTTDGGYSQSAKMGQPITVTDNLSHVTHLRYDTQGRMTSATDALGNETDFSYNLAGQSDTTMYPATGQTGSGQSHSTNPYLYVGGPLTTAISYDESNTQVRQVSRAFGAEGESLSVNGSTEPVTNTYDALYRVKTLKDGNNNTTTYAYNSVGLLSSITMPGSEVTQFTSYDNTGNLLQRIDGNGVTTNYVYNDSESLLTDIQYPATTSLNVHFTYDSYGRRSGMTDGTGSQSYSYGNLDELLSATTTYTGISAKTISYSYHPNGSRESMTTPAGTFDYSYDTGGRPSSMSNPFSETTSWAYQNNNWLQTQTLANGATGSYTYNALGQVTRLLNQIGSTTISDFSSIGYDGVGNRNSVTASIPGSTSLSGVTGYSYDTKDQLTQETSTRNAGFTDNFGYDSAGNPTSFKGVSKSYNSSNQQTGTGFTHDNNGNPTTYGGTTLTFDPENRMTAYGSVLTAGYTGDGLRAWKENATTRTYFLYDGILPVVETNSSGTVTATNTFGASGLVSRRVSTTSTFYSFDSEGNVAQRSDSSGTVLSNHLFSAHGVVLSGTFSEPFGYKAQFGYHTDTETGLQLLTHRYFDASSGRFLTRDPISYGGGINLYAYVTNNPTNSIDPLGLTRLVFYISTGTLVVITNEGFHYQISASSGRGDAMNDPRRTAERDIGAIPAGQYHIDMRDFTNPGYVGDILRNLRGDWGDWRVPIKPEPWNHASGRDGFFLHGGSIRDSAGCIDVGGGIHGDATTNFLRDELLRDLDGIIEVDVFPSKSIAGGKN